MKKEFTTEGLTKLSKECNAESLKAGFDNDLLLRILLAHGELSESVEAYRGDKYADLESYNAIRTLAESDPGIRGDSKIKFFRKAFEDHIKDSFEDEMADTVVRVLDICGKLNIDIGFHVDEKMKYNATRGHKFGGKKF